MFVPTRALPRTQAGRTRFSPENFAVPLFPPDLLLMTGSGFEPLSKRRLGLNCEVRILQQVPQGTRPRVPDNQDHVQRKKVIVTIRRPDGHLKSA
jgi:hypothetical protein